ncbi:MAG: DUF4347 domain-containing protein [Bdellovibrionales bacterium]|nr:DUF4347 domain-containing protein [Bdellovibrionales bacterium]
MSSRTRLALLLAGICLRIASPGIALADGLVCQPPDPGGEQFRSNLEMLREVFDAGAGWEVPDPDQESGPVVCAPCSEHTEVDLRITGMEDSTKWNITDARAFEYHHPHGLPRETYRVQSTLQIRSVIRNLAAECKHVRQLTLGSHGSAGALALGNEGHVLDHLNLKSAFPDGSDCVFAPGAQINFVSCNVGLGCQGTFFLSDLGRQVLKKGGKLVAATQYMSTFAPGIIPHFSIDGGHQEITLNGSGEVTEVSGETCRDEANQLLRQVTLARLRMKDCELPPEHRSLPRRFMEHSAALFEISGNDLEDQALALNPWDSERYGNLKYVVDRDLERLRPLLKEIGCLK